MADNSGMYMAGAQFPSVGDWWLQATVTLGSTQGEVRFTFYVNRLNSRHKMRNRAWRFLLDCPLAAFGRCFILQYTPGQEPFGPGGWTNFGPGSNMPSPLLNSLFSLPREQVSTAIDSTPSPEPTARPKLSPMISPVGPTATFTPKPTASLHIYSHYWQHPTHRLPPGIPGLEQLRPATLAMSLSYWGGKVTQYDIVPLTKPNPRDKNVMPYEMVDFVETQTDLKVISRVGGELQLLKQFMAAGFPVIIEKGFEGPEFDGWMGTMN